MLVLRGLLVLVDAAALILRGLLTLIASAEADVAPLVLLPALVVFVLTLAVRVVGQMIDLVLQAARLALDLGEDLRHLVAV